MDGFVFLVLFLAGVTAGAEAGSYFLLRPAKSKLSAENFVDLEKELNAQFGKFMPVLMIITTIGLFCTLLLFWSEDPLVKLLCLLGLLGYVTANALTIILMLPINKETSSWTSKNLPTNWKSRRARWEQVQGWRTWSMLAGFAALCAAVIIRP